MSVCNPTATVVIATKPTTKITITKPTSTITLASKPTATVTCTYYEIPTIEALWITQTNDFVITQDSDNLIFRTEA